MNKTLTLFLAFIIMCSLQASAQQSQGFSSVQSLALEPTTVSSGEKPQSKPWNYNGKWWAVFPNTSGTHLWRLDGTSWTNVLRLSSRTTSKADCKVVGNVTHILLYQGASSQMVSVEYDAAANTYQLWSKRTSTVGLTLDQGVETATIDIDSKGRMWLASAGVSDINVRWSDAPYHNWSPAITIASGVSDDDICAVVALPGKIGVFWSNQNTKRFGFKTHADGEDPSAWSSDEVPAAQSAQNIGNGMADDHMNLAVAGDGTLYCAVKTSYNTKGYPLLALLVRRPSGAWDRLYEVSQTGTRPIVILNEVVGKLKVVYSSLEGGGDILYQESATSAISFSPRFTLLSGKFNNATSSKDNYTSDVVILASNNTHLAGVLASDARLQNPPSTPLLASPANNSSGIGVPAALSWNASTGADTYQAQVSTSSSFTGNVFDQSGIRTTAVSVTDLAPNTTYYWRVRATNAVGSSGWSAAWSFTTSPMAATLVGHWKMDEGRGSTLADASGQANHASITGKAQWVTGISDLAIMFNGTKQYSTVPDKASLDITKAITLAAWVKPERQATQYILKKSLQGSVDGYELSLTSGGQVFLRINQASSGDTYRLNSKATYPTDGNTWMHVAATFDGTVMKIYLNGEENSSLTLPAPVSIKANDIALGIGAQPDGSTRFQGAVDEARVYGVALSASEVRALGNTTTPTAPGTPLLASPVDLITGVDVSPILSWNASEGANSYQAQVSTSSDFSSTLFDESDLTATSVEVRGLSHNTTYYWRVRATNAVGSSGWSAAWSFTTAPMTATLVGHWKMDEGSGSTLADASGQANDAAAVGDLSWVAGVSGSAIRLNGSNYATAPDKPSLDIISSITLAAWIKPSKLATQYVLKKAINGTVDGYELSLASGGQVFFRINQASSGDTYRLRSTATYPTDGNTWMHVAATFDGTVMKIYLNGEENGSLTLPAPVSIKANALALAIGAQPDGAARLRGSMDDARIYNTALSAAEVRDLASHAAALTATWKPAALQEGRLDQELSVHPNPSSSRALISFTLAEEGEYALSLYDARGAQVAMLKQGKTGAGATHTLELDSTGLLKGVYFIRLQAGKTSKTLKLLVDR